MVMAHGSLFHNCFKIYSYCKTLSKSHKNFATAHLSFCHQEGVGVGGQDDQRVEEPDEEYQLWCHPEAVAKCNCMCLALKMFYLF